MYHINIIVYSYLYYIIIVLLIVYYYSVIIVCIKMCLTVKFIILYNNV